MIVDPTVVASSMNNSQVYVPNRPDNKTPPRIEFSWTPGEVSAFLRDVPVNLRVGSSYEKNSPAASVRGPLTEPFSQRTQDSRRTSNASSHVSRYMGVGNGSNDGARNVREQRQSQHTGSLSNRTLDSSRSSQPSKYNSRSFEGGLGPDDGNVETGNKLKEYEKLGHQAHGDKLRTLATDDDPQEVGKINSLRTDLKHLRAAESARSPGVDQDKRDAVLSNITGLRKKVEQRHKLLTGMIWQANTNHGGVHDSRVRKFGRAFEQQNKELHALKKIEAGLQSSSKSVDRLIKYADRAADAGTKAEKYLKKATTPPTAYYGSGVADRHPLTTQRPSPDKGAASGGCSSMEIGLLCMVVGSLFQV